MPEVPLYARARLAFSLSMKGADKLSNFSGLPKQAMGFSQSFSMLGMHIRSFLAGAPVSAPGTSSAEFSRRTDVNLSGAVEFRACEPLPL
jgi:hypothetical protein